jgi:hypothetical protein
MQAQPQLQAMEPLQAMQAGEPLGRQAGRLELHGPKKSEQVRVFAKSAKPKA